MKEAKLVNLLRTKCCYCHLLFRFSKSNTYKWLESSHADTKISFFQIVAPAVVRVLTYTEETMCWIKMTKYLETTLWMRHKPYKEYSNTVIFIFVKPITVTKILVDCLFYLKYKLQGNFHELPHWIFQLLSKQCASELNLLAQNSCSSGVHNNVNFEQHGEAKISHECDPCVFKVLKEYSVICWPCCLQLIFGTYTMVTCLRASTKVCNLCGRHLSQNFSKWCHTQDLEMLLFALLDLVKQSIVSMCVMSWCFDKSFQRWFTLTN